MESDVATVQFALMRMAMRQQISGRDFNGMRSAAFHIRDRLPDLIAAIATSPAGESAKQDALAVLESFVAGLEFLLPLLDQVNCRASTH
jgi:hypothetical protein